MPHYSDLEYTESTERNRLFENANILNTDFRHQIEHQKIVDIHFCYYDNDEDVESKAYIELENGFFFTEENYGPQGLTTIDLEVLSTANFQERIANFDAESEIKSYLKQIRNAQ